MDNWTPRPLDPGMVTAHRRGRGKPLVLLHCLGQSWRFWDVLDPLMDRNELIAYSFPGHPGTPPPGHQYGAAELTEQLRAVALREGLARFHLMGISLGGWGSVLYAQQHQQAINGMLLLAPFLGERKVFDEILAAGGLDAWRPATVHPEDDQRLGLAWLADFKQSEASLKLNLGYGASDRFSKSNALIGARLPADQVQVIPGGHDWRTWLKLWQGFLDRGALGT